MDASQIHFRWVTMGTPIPKSKNHPSKIFSTPPCTQYYARQWGCIILVILPAWASPFNSKPKYIQQPTQPLNLKLPCLKLTPDLLANPPHLKSSYSTSTPLSQVLRLHALESFSFFHFLFAQSISESCWILLKLTLHYISRIWPFLATFATKTLVLALMLSCSDSAESLLTGRPASNPALPIISFPNNSQVILLKRKLDHLLWPLMTLRCSPSHSKANLKFLQGPPAPSMTWPLPLTTLSFDSSAPAILPALEHIRETSAPGPLLLSLCRPFFPRRATGPSSSSPSFCSNGTWHWCLSCNYPFKTASFPAASPSLNASLLCGSTLHSLPFHQIRLWVYVASLLE